MHIGKTLTFCLIAKKLLGERCHHFWTKAFCCHKRSHFKTLATLDLSQPVLPKYFFRAVVSLVSWKRMNDFSKKCLPLEASLVETKIEFAFYVTLKKAAEERRRWTHLDCLHEKTNAFKSVTNLQAFLKSTAWASLDLYGCVWQSETKVCSYKAKYRCRTKYFYERLRQLNWSETLQVKKLDIFS